MSLYHGQEKMYHQDLWIPWDQFVNEAEWRWEDRFKL